MDEVAELDEGVLALPCDRRPWGRGGGRLLAAGVGQLVDALARLRGGLLDEVLVLELLEGRVDGAGARLPDAPRALGDLLDDLVAVHRLLAEQDDDGGADVAAARPAPERVLAAVAAPVPPAVAAGHEVRPAVPAATGLGDDECRHDSPSVYIAIYRNTSIN